MPLAVVTGASSGLGAEYARHLAQRGADLILVARDGAALEDIARRVRAHGRKAEVLVADLLDDEQRATVEETLRSRPVDVLVNNAGFGLGLEFDRNDIDDEVAHLRLHVETTMRLTHAVLPGMIERGRGRILNVASVAAFIPRSTYAACKRWVVSFSEWASAHYAPRGVTVTAVCPGFTHTNFHERMGLEPGREGIPSWMWLDAADVVRESLGDAARGRAVSIPSRRYKLLAGLGRILPGRLSTRIGSRGRL